MTEHQCQGQINVMGGLHYHDRFPLSFFVDKGNGESFFEQLVLLNKFVYTGCELKKCGVG